MEFVRRWFQGPATGDEERCADGADAEAEAWSERTAVITKYDHEINCQLARTFVQDLADRVVTDNYKEADIAEQDEEEACVTPEPEEDKSAPIGLTISAKKQQLFLPDLVPSASVARPADTVSESDEYESADEQPLHDTVYLDSTVNGDEPVAAAATAEASGESTPTDAGAWSNDLDASTVFVPGVSVLGAEDIDCEPIVASTPAIEEKPFVEQVPSEPDDFDLASQFEKLALSKRHSSTEEAEEDDKEDAACPPGETDSCPLNQTVCLDVAQPEEASLLEPASRLDQTFEQSAIQTALCLEAEPADDASPSDQVALDQTRDIDTIEQPANQTVSLEEVEPVQLETLPDIAHHESFEQPTSQTVCSDAEPVGEEESIVPVNDSERRTADIETFEQSLETKQEEESAVIVELLANGALAPSEFAVAATEVVGEDEAAACDSVVAPEDNPAATSEALRAVSADSAEPDEPEAAAAQPEQPSAPAPAADSQVEEDDCKEAAGEVAEESTKLPDDEQLIVPKKGYDLSFLDRLDNLENAVPGQTLRSSPPPLPPVAASFHAPSSPAVEPAAAEAASCLESTERTTEILDSTFTATVQDNTIVESTAAIVDPAVPVVSEEIPVPTAIDVTNEQKMEQDEEEIVVPKKGYDLSWLDKLDDLENASPTTAVSAKSKVMNTKKQQETAKKEVADEASPASETAETPADAAAGKCEEKPSPTKKAPAARKPIRPRFQRPAAAAAAAAAPGNKTDPFEIEFKFDANDDPFKSNAKLGCSPPKGEAGAVSASEDGATEANDTITTPKEEVRVNGDGAAIEAADSLAARLSASATNDQTLVHEDEEFRPAEEVFGDAADLDYLMQHGGGGGSSREIALARQSLFVKFDPLVGGRPSMFPGRQPDGATGAGGDAAAAAAAAAVLEEEPAGRASSSGESLFMFSPPHPSSGGAGSKADSKREMAATGVHHPSSASASASSASTSAVDCLLSMENRVVPDDVVGLHEHREALKLQELLFQDKLLQKEREIQMKDNENHDIRAKLEGTIEAQAQMRQIVGEYEKTISQLIADKEREKAGMETTLQNTIKERDQAIEDLKEVERAFSEFHRMYERNRAAVENHNKNEEALKKTLAAYQERLQQEQQKYETLKLHAAQKLEGVQQEMENMKRALEAESSRVKAQLKKTEMRLASVETSLEQKSKENEELTKLCDELINKLGFSAK